MVIVALSFVTLLLFTALSKMLLPVPGVYPVLGQKLIVLAVFYDLAALTKHYDTIDVPDGREPMTAGEEQIG
jgi:hypothetical protein